MKNSILSLALATAMTTAPAAFAGEGTLTVTGLLTDATCTVTGTGNATGTGDVLVKLDTYSINDFVGTAPLGEKDFSLDLSGGTDCADGKVYSMQFHGGGPNADANGNLNNAATTDAATGVQIRIVGSNGNPINFQTDENAPESGVIVSGQGQLTGMRAGYVANGTPTSGYVNTSVEYILTHN
jgi:major type 1 subunit fimbrin (pilin)